MWKVSDFDHVNIGVSVCELDGSGEGEEGLLAYSTSFVDVNHQRPGETAVFQCEIHTCQDYPGYRVHMTTIVTRGMWDGEVIWAQNHDYFLNENYEPTIPGLEVDELARRTINEYGRRSKAHESGGVYIPCP
jgi:hypothetical protein